MKEIRFFYVPEAASATELPPDEAIHALRVLRLKEGDELMLTDGQGVLYGAVVSQVANHRCHYQVESVLPQQPQWHGRIHLAIAPTKLNDPIEWMAEKTVEVGIDELSFLSCQFSERRQLKIERVARIVVAAMKQSHKAWMPQVNDMMPFSKFIATHTTGHRFIAHCYNEVPRVNLFDALCSLESSADALVLVGPEGDFSLDEVRQAIAKGFVSVDLGKSRLRTETAGLTAVMMMQLAKQVKL